MDTGSSTCFLGDVVAVGHGAADRPSGTVMTAAHFRANMPAEWRGGYEALVRGGEGYGGEGLRGIRAVGWARLRAAEWGVGRGRESVGGGKGGGGGGGG